MAVTCSGVIRDPSNNPVPNLRITLRSIGTNATSLDGSEIVVTTGADGSYSFPLQEGRYGVFMDFGQELFIGEAVITPTTGDDTLNQYLINVELSSVVGSALAEFEQFRDDTVTAAAEGAASAAASLASQQAAAASATVSQSHIAIGIAKAIERDRNREKFAGSGWEHFGKHSSSASFTKINQGLASFISAGLPNTLFMGRRFTDAVGTSKTDEAVMQMAGFTVFMAKEAGAVDSFNIKFPVAPDGRDTYNSTTGAQVRHADVATAFAAETADIQVVTRRVDMWGFEGFLEEITTLSPFVYPKGLIQSQASTMNGIATVAGTRPATYYAVFTGDTTSNGRGVNYFTASEAQQEAMLGDKENNLYYLPDGRLVQFHVRQRTIAGAGNGDWTNLNAQSALLNSGIQFNGTRSVLKPHGHRDSIASSLEQYTDSLISDYLNANNAFTQPSNFKESQGLFAIRSTGQTGIENFAVNGECYFLVGGTVSRLNQGAYHPELNSFGSKRSNNNGTGFSSGVDWNSSAAIRFTSSAQCFNQVDASTDSTTVGAAQATGSIGAPSSGRTNDNRLHDAIYADGLGGVVDYRWSANDRSDPKWGTQAKLEAEAGEYRGLERLQRTSFAFTASASGANRRINHASDGSGLDQSEIVHSFIATNSPDASNNTGVTLYNVTQARDISNNCWLFATDVHCGSADADAGDVIMATVYIDVSVSGNFTRTDAIGDPVNLLATFPTGFEGGWVNTVPDGTTMNFVLTKKDVPGNPEGIRTTDNGVSWTNDGLSGFDPTINANPSNYSATTVNLVSYTADAKKTKRSTNVELLNAYSGQYGVTAVAFFSPGWGALLFESMLGKVATSTASVDGIIQTYPFTLLNLRSVNGLVEDFAGRESQHAPLMLAAPTNDSRGIKYAAHQVNDNGQATLNFIFNELGHNGTDWGDDSRLRILNGTYTNQNGVTGLVADVDTLAIPYGLIKNEV